MLSLNLQVMSHNSPFSSFTQPVYTSGVIRWCGNIDFHTATMTHAGMSAEARAQAGITDSLLRISVGIEDPQDLITDLDHAFQVAAQR